MFEYYYIPFINYTAREDSNCAIDLQVYSRALEDRIKGL